jgi:hypothetical protein
MYFFLLHPFIAVSHQIVDRPMCRALGRVRSNLTSADGGGIIEVCVGVNWTRFKEGRVQVDSPLCVENISQWLAVE